ncbi:MAG: hypothetical protein ACFB13_20495 [Kiloniellaceae bacterium]
MDVRLSARRQVGALKTSRNDFVLEKPEGIQDTRGSRKERPIDRRALEELSRDPLDFGPIALLALID